MYDFFKKALDLVQEDNALEQVPVDIQSILSSLIQGQRHSGILLILDMISSDSIGNQSLHYLKSLCLLQEGNLEKSEVSIITALSIDQRKNNGKQQADFNALYAEIYKFKQSHDKQAMLNEIKGIDVPNYLNQFVRTDLTITETAFRQRQKAIQDGAPSILSMSTARAASSYIANQLSRFLGGPRVNIDAQDTPIEHDVAQGLLEDFKRGGAISYVHSRASKKNIDALLGAKLNKFILHVRDPRQCFLSNYYRMHVIGDWYDRRVYYNQLPLDYEQMSFEQHMDWHIENVYEHYWVKWIEEWFDIATTPSNGFQINIVTYEDFMVQPLDYFQGIGEFFDLDWSGYTDEDLLISDLKNKTEVGGRVDFWRQKLTAEQVEKVQSLTPDSLLENFGWKR